jgi:hypothetical protein
MVKSLKLFNSPIDLIDLRIFGWGVFLMLYYSKIYELKIDVIEIVSKTLDSFILENFKVFYRKEI